MENKDNLFFFGTGKNKKWCKKEVFNYLTPKDQSWTAANQIQATFLMVKKTSNNEIIEHWYDLALHYPQLFIDVPEKDKEKECSKFKEHRHDQAVLMGCIASAENLDNCCFLPSKIEKRVFDGQAVLASRISATEIRGATPTSKIENPFITLINRLIVYPLLKKISIYFLKRSH
jgi:hypothetical protein